MDYNQAIDYIHAIPKFVRPLGNEKLGGLLSLLENPHKHTKFVHVAGTNGKGSVSVMTAERHDKLIAFTSQLAHIVSNAYVKSPSSTQRKGISAGSYKDLTRVAYLNENMWTELFLENKDNLIFELDYLIEELKKYSDSMKNDDAVDLKKLLKEGREAKERAD